MTNFTPWFRSPFTDLTGALISHQFYGRCGDIEMNLLDCMEAYGLKRSEVKCETLYNDFRECATRTKQMKRAFAMRNERNRQYWAGERTKEDRYAEAPPLASF